MQQPVRMQNYPVDHSPDRMHTHVLVLTLALAFIFIFLLYAFIHKIATVVPAGQPAADKAPETERQIRKKAATADLPPESPAPKEHMSDVTAPISGELLYMYS